MKYLMRPLNWAVATIFAGAMIVATFFPVQIFADKDWAPPLAMLLVAAGLLLSYLNLQHFARRWSPTTYRRVLWGIGGLIVIAQLAVALSFVDAGRADAFFVRNQAIALAQGLLNWSQYFKIYPNNVNFTLLEAGFLKVAFSLGWQTPWAGLNVLRFIWIDTGLLAGLVLLKHWRNWQPGALSYLLAWGLSVPLYAYGVFAYTDALVLPLMVDVAALLVIVRQKTGWQRWLWSMLSWLVLGLGIVMKSNMIVVWVAVVLILCVAAWQHQWSWRLVGQWLIGSMVVLVLFSGGMNRLAKVNGYQKDANTALPVTSWMAMSLNPKLDGQYNHADFTKVRLAKTAAAKKQTAQTMIKTRVTKMGARGLVVHLARKFRVFFATGDFDSFKLTTQWLQAPRWYIRHQRSWQFWLVLWTQCWYLVWLLGGIVAVLRRRQAALSLELLALATLGLTMFHVGLWEVEARYALPLLPVVLMLGIQGWSTVWLPVLTKKRLALASGVTVVGAVIVSGQLLNLSNQTHLKQTSVTRQGNGSYVLPDTLKIAVGQTQTVHLTTPIASNELELHPASKTGRVTVTIRQAGHLIKRVTGTPKKTTTVNYRQTKAGALTISITNRGPRAVTYHDVKSWYNQQTGQRFTKAQPALQYKIFLNHKRSNLSTLTTVTTLVGLLSLSLMASWWALWRHSIAK
ncbi:hypothetical protein [Lactiplantibacillus fabifermentans]|uniref:Integral membrane protein n=2 Tax=Lactiplantibacillus fabifermentans TaxID=483011 RepID=A0A0R2NRJ9_9LACO|nr:hypothetical protein [Lactiplantibacillus fabifermentans]ETY74344.1 membrane protein [Lactiplantibacillus fabifermentans T30PCM01]KRO28295.1 integral membrane protein [Lactiplantibacillus fabifermentans DSM 21115]